ncbi:MAG TPA: methyltransferase domain-containing protein [Ktedonobacterales bacterium]|jgi:O-methyltransferase/aklanonic acid methyltransferase
MDTPETQKQQIAGLYDRVAAAYGSVGPNFFAHVGAHLIEHIGITPGARVLDVAAGRGANLFPAARQVGPRGQVIGIDLAPGMVQETTAELARRGISHASMLHMDAEHLTFPDASFDYLLCGFAIFLFPHLEQALAHFFRVVRPGGKIGISVASDLHALSHWFGQRLTDYHQRHQFPIRAGGGQGSNYAQLPQHLSLAGFTAIEVRQEQADFTYADPQEWWSARWTHGPRYALEHMPPAVLAQFQAEVLARLAQEAASGGIHETLNIQYILASKDGSTKK